MFVVYCTCLMSKRSLEQYRIFPYIAWILVGGFALFVYHLTTELNAYQNELAASTTALEERASMNPLEITDFSPR